jgi:hypothetical protein
MKDFPIYFVAGMIIWSSVHTYQELANTHQQLAKLQERQSNQTENLLQLRENGLNNDDKYLGGGELPSGPIATPTMSAPDGETWLRTTADRQILGFDNSNRVTPFWGQLYGMTSGTIHDASTGDMWRIYALFDQTGQKNWYAKLLPMKGQISPSFINYKKHNQ